MMYGSWDIKCDRHNFLSSSAIFCPFATPPLKTQKMKISKKWKHLEIPLIFFILANFLLFYPPNSPKNENFKKKEKKPGAIIILHKCTKSHDYMLYCSRDMVCDRCNCYFSFLGYFLSFYSPNSPKNLNFKKKKKKKRKIEKNFWRYHHFTHVHHKLWLDDVGLLKYGVRQMGGETDGWTDGRTEKVTYRGGCPT